MKLRGRQSILWLTLVLGTAVPDPARAGIGVWTTGGPYGYPASTLAVDPVHPTTIYVGINRTGLYKSTDSGGTWRSLGSIQVLGLAIDPVSPSTLYALTQYAGLYKSTNFGETWASANKGLDVDVSVLVIDPTTPSTLYAGTSRGKLFKCTDGGVTWAAVGSLSGYFTALAIDPVNATTLYAGTYTPVDVGIHQELRGAVYRSTDSGTTWTESFNGIFPVLTTSFSKLIVDPANPATLYARAFGSGVFKSTDAGSSWALANTGLRDLNVTDLVLDSTRLSTLYAGALNGGVFKSTDSGVTWVAINAGMPLDGVGALALDPTGPTVYAGLASYGVPVAAVWQATAPDPTPALLLPASAHAPGLGESFYTTDVMVSNTGSSNAIFRLQYLANGQDGSSGPVRTFHLDAGNSVTFTDILGSVFETFPWNNFGAIRVTSDRSLASVSVTSTRGFGGRFGQTIPAVQSSQLISAGSSRSLLYVREGDGFRSNLILANDSFAPTTIDVALVSPAGSTLATRSYDVPPNGMIQVTRIVRDMAVPGPVSGARLVLTSETPGAAFTGMLSVIDETTNDPTTIATQPASMSGSPPYTWLIPAVAHQAGLGGAYYTSNLAVANTGATPVTFTLKFLGHDQNGVGGPEQTFSLGAGNSVTLFDVLGAVFGVTAGYGALRITSPSPTLNAVSVTSTPGFGGTFGQTVPAVPAAELIPAGVSRSVLYVHEGDGSRTNLILCSNASVATDVDVEVLGGVIPTRKTYTVPPNGMTQILRVAEEPSHYGAVRGARLVISSTTPGAAFTAMTSVIDEVTNDPTTILPQ